MPVAAAPSCEEPALPGGASETWVLRVANDFFARQDQNLTSGLQLKRIQRVGGATDACRSSALLGLQRLLARAGPAEPEQAFMSLGAGQLLYTPQEAERRDLILEDRPYAAVALGTAGYSARKGAQQHATELSLGWVGPAALGEQTQNLAHKVFGSRRFEGWDNQLRNEPIVMLAHDRAWRHGRYRVASLEADSFTHAGATLGNLMTRGEAGFEWRLGSSLPDDFGSDPLRLLGTGTTPRAGSTLPGTWAWHVFLSANGRWVLRDITLDGNTARDSHQVQRRPWVAAAALGFAVSHGRWSLAFARGSQTREFEGQTQRPALGSLSFSATLD